MSQKPHLPHLVASSTAFLPPLHTVLYSRPEQLAAGEDPAGAALQALGEASAQPFSTASASSPSVAKWKSGLVTVLGTGLPPKPFWSLRRSIQQTL